MSAIEFPVDAFLNTGVEVSAVYTHDGGTPLEITGHFVNEFEMLSMGYDAENVSSVFYAKESDVPQVAHNDTLEVGGKVYRIVSIQPDGYGFVLLELSLDEY